MKKPKIKLNNEKKGKSTLIGYNHRKPVYIPDNCKHVFICGTTGSGKTVALSNFVYHAVKEDFSLLVVDGKGDIGPGSLLSICKKLCCQHNKRLYIINLSQPEQSNKYNPFCNASPTACKDMLINMTDWSEEHYKSNTERSVFVLIARVCYWLFDMINDPYKNKNTVNAFFALVSTLGKLFFEIIIWAFTFLFNLAFAVNNRGGEYVADRFAHKNGYGEDLISALYLLQKMSLGEDSKLVSRMLASHPRISKRIMTLENALSENE